MHQEITILEKPHWIPQDEELTHEVPLCWCDPIEFPQFFAHRKKFKHVVPALIYLYWEPSQSDCMHPRLN